MPTHRQLSGFSDKWPEILKIFRTILYGNIWKIVVTVNVKLGKCPEHFEGQQEHCTFSSQPGPTFSFN